MPNRIIALFSSPDSFAAPTSNLAIFRAPKTGRIIKVTIDSFLAPSGDDADFDLLKNFVSAQPLTLADGTNSVSEDVVIDVVEGTDTISVDLLDTPSAVGADLCIRIEMQVEEPAGTPAQITSNQNDYQGAGFNRVQRVSSDASRNVTGYEPAGEAPLDGQESWWVNVGSNDIVLKHQDTGSAAANRFLNTTAADLTLAANRMALMIYDGTTAQWRVTLLP